MTSRKPHIHPVRFTADEYATLKHLAAEAGTGIAKYIRETVLRERPRPTHKVATATLETVRELGRLENNFRQIVDGVGMRVAPQAALMAERLHNIAQAIEDGLSGEELGWLRDLGQELNALAKAVNSGKELDLEALSAVYDDLNEFLGR